METQQQQQPWWRMRFSFRSATILVCSLNLVAVLFLLQSFFPSASRSSVSGIQSNPAILKHIKECEEMRLAMQPLELIRRVREIEQEGRGESKPVQQIGGTKQTAAVDLSKRLKDFRSLNDAASLKALEEWRKRKLERARQRQLEKNGTNARL